MAWIARAACVGSSSSPWAHGVEGIEEFGGVGVGGVGGAEIGADEIGKLVDFGLIGLVGFGLLGFAGFAGFDFAS